MYFDIEAVDAGLPFEARAYLELRLFAALSQPEAPVFAVRAEIRRTAGAGSGDEIRCRIRVLRRAGGDVVVERRGSELYAVIDRVAEAAAEAVAVGDPVA